MKYILLLLTIILLTAVSCRKKDCSEIDLTRLADIKLPDSVKTVATSLEVFLDEADVYLASDHKLIMRCRPEKDFENDQVLPGVMLWITDQWDLTNNQSKLGKIFAAKDIEPWERSRIAGILYHRHLNDLELKTEELLEEGSIKTGFRHRIISQKVLSGFTPAQQAQLKTLAFTTDTTFTAAGVLELRLTYNKNQKSVIEKLVAQRDSLTVPLQKLMIDIQRGNAPDENIMKVIHQDKIFSASTLPQKIILLEQFRQNAVVKELVLLKRL